ncbi:MAG: hypothetical protein ACQER9_03980 [Nanobdellota archaeon]
MKKVILKTGIQREPGFLYFIDKQGNISRSNSSVGSTKGGKLIELVKNTNLKKKKGYIYYINSTGDIVEAQMNRKGGKKKTETEKQKPKVKFIVYESKKNNKPEFKSKKITLPSSAKNIKTKRPSNKEGKYGTKINYDYKVDNEYKPSSKFITLKRPAKNLRLVNTVPKKYEN